MSSLGAKFGMSQTQWLIIDIYCALGNLSYEHYEDGSERFPLFLFTEMAKKECKLEEKHLRRRAGGRAGAQGTFPASAQRASRARARAHLLPLAQSRVAVQSVQVKSAKHRFDSIRRWWWSTKVSDFTMVRLLR